MVRSRRSWSTYTHSLDQILVFSCPGPTPFVPSLSNPWDAPTLAQAASGVADVRAALHSQSPLVKRSGSGC